jgi:tyrosyl-tRNA synthetase
MFLCCRLLQRFEIVRSVGEECTQENELLNILASKPEPVCYDGFEPSGRMTIDEVIIINITIHTHTHTHNHKIKRKFQD